MRLAYGSYSGVTQLMYTSIKNAARADMTLLPNKGEGPTVTDALGDHVQLTFATPISTLAHTKEGKLRALDAAANGADGSRGRPAAVHRRHLGRTVRPGQVVA